MNSESKPTAARIDISEGELLALTAALKEGLIVLGRIKKRHNAYVTQVKMKERGTHAGRPKKRNDKAIGKLRNKGLSIRKIAEIEGVSTAAVQRSLRAIGEATGRDEG